MAKQTTCELFLRPASAELRFLPEGPYTVDGDRCSWVSIQFSPQSMAGALNITNLYCKSTLSYALPGRPGFAFPTDRDGTFVIGLERSVVLLDTKTGAVSELVGGIDSSVSGTIINDGIAFSEGLVFGAKDLKFQEKKAGLYFYRTRDGKLFTLRNDQLCSNGKVMNQVGSGRYELFDIDSPTKQVVRYELDTEKGTLSEPKVVLDFTSGEVFPDGMVGTPDGKSVIIAFFDPRPSQNGEARQYNLATGALEHVWTVPESPQVTCPQLIRIHGKVALLLTSASENMSAEQLAQHRNAGCLFIGATDFSEVPSQPQFALNRK